MLSLIEDIKLRHFASQFNLIAGSELWVNLSTLSHRNNARLGPYSYIKTRTASQKKNYFYQYHFS